MICLLRDSKELYYVGGLSLPVPTAIHFQYNFLPSEPDSDTSTASQEQRDRRITTPRLKRRADWTRVLAQQARAYTWRPWETISAFCLRHQLYKARR